MGGLGLCALLWEGLHACTLLWKGLGELALGGHPCMHFALERLRRAYFFPVFGGLHACTLLWKGLGELDALLWQRPNTLHLAQGGL